MNRNEELRYRLRRWIEATPNGGEISYPELMSDPRYAPPPDAV